MPADYAWAVHDDHKELSKSFLGILFEDAAAGKARKRDGSTRVS